MFNLITLLGEVQLILHQLIVHLIIKHDVNVTNSVYPFSRSFNVQEYQNQDEKSLYPLYIISWVVTDYQD